MKSAAGKRFFKIILGLLIVLVLVLSGQISKQAAVEHLKNSADLILIPGVLQLHYLENTGAAFSLLEGNMTLFYHYHPHIDIASCLSLPANARPKTLPAAACGLSVSGCGRSGKSDRPYTLPVCHRFYLFFPDRFPRLQCGGYLCDLQHCGTVSSDSVLLQGYGRADGSVSAGQTRQRGGEGKRKQKRLKHWKSRLMTGTRENAWTRLSVICSRTLPGARFSG